MEAEGRSFSKALRDEGRALRSATTRLGFAAAALVCAGVLIIVGLVACFVSVFLALQQPLGTPGAAAATGAIAIAFGVGLLAIAKWVSE
ncbi:MAG: hypothetical protein ACREJD_15285 [Phycisphaerales bacterium]